MGYTISNKTIEGFFGLLHKLDVKSKKRLIVKLKESIEIELKKDKTFELKNLFGAWEDERDSDTIIKEIQESRVNSSNLEQF